MVSNNHDNYHIVVSKEITQASSSSKNIYGLSKYDSAESSSRKKYALSKGKDDNVKNKRVVNVIALDNNNKLFHVEEEVNICDTCGDLGWERLLVICGKCKIGAQHTYCMITKVDAVPDIWSCYDCTKDQDKMREREGNEETSSRKRKAESLVDYFEVTDKKKGSCLLNIQNNRKILDLDLNTDMEEKVSTYLFAKDLSKGPSTDLIKTPYLFGIDLSKGPITDLIKTPGININENRDT